MLATKYRTKRSFLAGLLISICSSSHCGANTVATIAKVSRVSPDRTQFDMSQDSADKALALVFRSPASSLTIEFQGGEPLLNFELIKHVIERAEQRNETAARELKFVITTNLALISDPILEFLPNAPGLDLHLVGRPSVCPQRESAAPGQQQS